MTAIQVYDYGDRHSRLGCSNRNYKNGEKDPIQFVRIQVFIEDNEVDIYAIQDQFNCHEHCDHIAPGKQPVCPDKKQRGTDKQYMGNGYLVHFSVGLALNAMTIQPTMAASKRILTTSNGSA
jgi:hypothetical protein